MNILCKLLGCALVSLAWRNLVFSTKVQLNILSLASPDIITCLVTAVSNLSLVNPFYLALIPELVIKQFQVWRLITNFFFLGGFSVNFGIRLLMIARYGVQLEKGPFERRTADFLWMMIFGSLIISVLSFIHIFWSPFLGISLVFMLLYLK